MMMGEMTQWGSLMGAVMLVWAILGKLVPDEFQRDARKYFNKVVSYVYPYVEITFHEYEPDTWFERSKAYMSIERYLSATSSTRAKKLKANSVRDCESVVLSMDEYQEVTDEFHGIQVWWISSKTIPEQRALFSRGGGGDEKRFYRLTCKREHRDVITKSYLQHVLEEGKAIAVRTRQRKLYTNSKSSDDSNWYSYKTSMWSHICDNRQILVKVNPRSTKVNQCQLKSNVKCCVLSCKLKH